MKNFSQDNEQIYSKALLSVISCIHFCVFKTAKSLKHLNEFSYKTMVKVLDSTKSKDLKLATARFISSILPKIPPTSCENLLLHLISLYKDENTISEEKDVIKSLTSLLYYYENSKTIGITTGFSEFLTEKGIKLVFLIQNLEIQKKKKDEENSLIKDLQELIILFKL